jgi:hypothetical protein
VTKQNRGAQRGITVILVIGFGQFFVGLRVNAILNVGTVDSDENNLSAALDSDLGMWIGWNVLKFYRRRCGSRNRTFLSCS